MDRERRLVDLVVASGEDVGVGGGGRAQQPHGQLALVEHLGVAQRHLVAGRAAHLDAHPSGEVLAEVDDGDVGRRLLDRHGAQRLDAPDRRAGRRDHPVGDRGQLVDSGPTGVVEPGRRPGGVGEPGVVGLAVVEAGGDARVGRRSPLAIGDHGVAAAVVVEQFELGDRTDVGAVGVAPAAVEAETSPVPTLGDGDPEHIVAVADRIRDVEGRVAESMAVRGPAGGEDLVAERGAVAGDGVDAECRDVQPRPDHGRPGR